MIGDYRGGCAKKIPPTHGEMGWGLRPVLRILLRLVCECTAVSMSFDRHLDGKKIGHEVARSVSSRLRSRDRPGILPWPFSMPIRLASVHY